MIEKLAVGPPIQGFPGTSPRDALRESAREGRSGSFSRTLEEKISFKNSEPPRGKEPPAMRKEIEDRPSRAENSEMREKPGEKRATTAREKAIQKFMDSFESEFGIPPTKMVEAMALLKPQDLNKPPEETAAIVVDGLDLSEDDEARAQAMYASLLVDLRRIDRAEQPPEFVTQNQAATAPFMQERLQTTQLKRDAMNRSVDLLNKNFWQTAPEGSGAQAADPTASQLLSSDRWAMEEGADLAAFESSAALAGLPSAEELTEGLSAEAAQKVTEALSAAEQSPTPENLNRLMNEMKAVAEQREAKSSPEAAALGANMASPGSAEAKVSKAASVRMDASAPTAPSLPTAKMAFSEKFGQDGGKEERSSSEGGSSKEVVKPLTGQLAPLKMEDVAAALKASAPVAAPAAAAAMSLTPADNEANVRQLMNQAQYLIKKGGGEVKVEMTPEGMGKIQMKVLLQDGKVNVQMSTETHEAKKAIESSLSELRSSLAAQKLSVDHVKIDVVNGPNADNQARNDMNMNQQGRDTRQFWNQFQEQFGNRGAREGMWDAPSLKGYRQFKSPEPLEPLETKIASVSRADGRGRGIDLVA